MPPQSDLDALFDRVEVTTTGGAEILSENKRNYAKRIVAQSILNAPRLQGKKTKIPNKHNNTKQTRVVQNFHFHFVLSFYILLVFGSSSPLICFLVFWF